MTSEEEQGGGSRPDTMSESIVSSGRGSGSDLGRHQGWGGMGWGGDINSAAALRAQYAIETPRVSRRRGKKDHTATVMSHSGPVATTSASTITSSSTPTSAASTAQSAPSKDATTASNNDNNGGDGDDEPLVDTTAPLELHSKKTERQQRKAQRRVLKTLHQQAHTTTLQSLPSELLVEILSHLAPSTLFVVLRTTRHLRTTILTHETSLMTQVIGRRYAILSHCFPLPVRFATLDPQLDHPGLLHPKRLESLAAHARSYRAHIAPLDSTEVCTCMTCVFAWNNLALVLDLHHWQDRLDRHEPLPIVRPGEEPAWNAQLLADHAKIVRKALASPLAYARVLEMHLDTTQRTVLRHAEWTSRHEKFHRRAAAAAAAATGNPSSPSPSPSTTTPSPASTGIALTGPTSPKHRLYRVTDDELEAGTDAFLARASNPSYDFPYNRDVYYGLEAYVPNRKWSAQTRRWHYYDPMPAPHRRDLEWVRSWGRRVEAVGGGGGGGVLNIKKFG